MQPRPWIPFTGVRRTPTDAGPITVWWPSSTGSACGYVDRSCRQGGHRRLLRQAPIKVLFQWFARPVLAWPTWKPGNTRRISTGLLAERPPWTTPTLLGVGHCGIQSIPAEAGEGMTRCQRSSSGSNMMFRRPVPRHKGRQRRQRTVEPSSVPLPSGCFKGAVIATMLGGTSATYRDRAGAASPSQYPRAGRGRARRAHQRTR